MRSNHPVQVTGFYRKSVFAAGVLLIAGTIAGILSVAPAIDASDYLTKAAASEFQVRLSAFFQLLMAAAYLGVPVLLYPILRRYRQSYAIGSVSLCIVSVVFNVIGVMLMLLLLPLSNRFLQAGGSDLSLYQTLGELFRAGRDLANHFAVTFSFVTAIFLLNALFYRENLLPKWLACWGMIGSVLSMLASTLFLLHVIGLDTAYMLLNVPVALQELAMAIWMIVKGFNPTVLNNIIVDGSK